MRRLTILLAMPMLLFGLWQATATNNSALVVQRMNLMPLAFTQNNGQWDEQIVFRGNAGGATFWFTQDGVYYQFARKVSLTPSPLPLGEGWPKDGVRADDSLATTIITATFVGANSDPEIVGEAMTEYKCNYFLGDDPTEWRTDVPNYKAVIYKDIYPGIDLKYYGSGDGKMEYDFIIQPGADPSLIAVRYDGAKGVCVDDAGQLVVETEWGEITEPAPIVYQIDGEKRIPIGCQYVMLYENTFAFELTAGYQPTLALVIDPALSYSTYLGGSGDDYGRGIAVDGSGAVYVTGFTGSTAFPTLNAYQTHQGNYDAFITKLSSSGKNLIYSTYLGGGSGDHGYGIAVDDSGAVYVTGSTASADFPTQNGYQATYQGVRDAFVIKLSSAGNSLIYSTYLGGSNSDYGSDVAVDESGAAYATGYTFSADFPTLNAYRTYQGSDDVFITKLSSSGSNLIYSTCLGGSGSDYGSDIALDDDDAAYVAGGTGSANFPTENAYQTHQGGYDAFVTKLSSSGSTLVYSTYLGGSSGEAAFGIAVDDLGAAYVTGATASADFPTHNAYQGYRGDYDAFVAKLSSSGSSLIYGTYLGGGGDDNAFSIAVDDSGAAYVTGATVSEDFPILDEYQTYQDSNDVFVTRLSSSGNSLIYSTYLGGSGQDDGFDIAVDWSGGAYVTGSTGSTDFPTLDAYQPDQGIYDAFVTKVGGYPPFLCGDVDGTGDVNISDAVYLICYIFADCSAPTPVASGDVDCDGAITIGDAVYLIAYIFAGGPAPCEGC